MDNRKRQETMAMDDIPFSLIVVTIGIYFSCENYKESDWIGLVGTVSLFLFGVLWLSARVYHLTHKDEVFGNDQP